MSKLSDRLYMGILWSWRKKHNIGFYTSAMDKPFRELSEDMEKFINTLCRECGEDK